MLWFGWCYSLLTCMSISPQMWAHAGSVEFHHKKHKSSILKGKLKDRPTFCKRMVIHLLDTNWPQSEKGLRTDSVLQWDRAFLGQVAAPRVTRHFWHVVGCSAAAEHLCSQRLLCSNGLALCSCSAPHSSPKQGLQGQRWTSVDLLAPSVTHPNSFTNTVLICYWYGFCAD